MNQLNVQKTAYVFALVIGGWHVVWSLLVGVGIGQLVYDYLLWAHMIHVPVVVGPFNLMASITLIIVTFVFGYIMGRCFAYCWNKLHSAK